MRGKFSFLYVGIWFDVTKCDKSPYSVRIRENTDQNNSEYGHILCSGYHYFPWQSKYFNLKTNCHIKPKFFVKTKLRDNLLHAKYLISVHVALTLKLFHYFQLKDFAQYQTCCSRQQIFFKIGVLKNFAIFTEKHLCWSLFLIKADSNTGILL